MNRLCLCAAFAVLASCGGDGGGGGAGVASGPLSIASRFPIDGVVNFSALTGVQSAALTFLDLGGAPVKTTTLTWAFANDDVDLYVAFEWTDDTFNNGYTSAGPTDFDGVQLLIDGNGNLSYETNEDKRIVIAATVGSFYIDQHQAAGNEDDTIGDGYGKLLYDSAGMKYQAEFRFPMAQDAAGQDGPITTASRYNIILYDHVQFSVPTLNRAYLHANVTDSSAWPAVPYASVAPIPRPGLPGGLNGLIVFTSQHEDPNGEIYTFDPATGVVTRVTNNALFEDHVSLSHDRTRIAFTGAPSWNAFSSYEIYTINADGTGLTQLTGNAIIDGHPAWSPDDAKIAYASFRDPKASIILMTPSGAELADLTPSAYDDNDPEWLPDGRIVFKTDRFTALPQVKIAVMNDDGTGVQPLTGAPGTSDHDPVGDATHAVFERFMKGTDYSTDIEAGFTPWNIIEARLDGTGERTVVADGWVNWLPVYDPTGQYLAHLKGVGYTETRLVTRAGQDLGRLIPSITKIRYLDWK